MTDERAAHRDRLRDDLEALLSKHIDFLAANAEMPMLGDWVLLVCHDDAADNTRGAFYKLNRAGQWTHRTVGLLIAAADDYREIVREEP